MMPKKIGLFIESEPFSGGMFKYNQIMLNAVAALPKNKFSVVVVYTSGLWVKYFDAYNLKTVFAQSSFFGSALGYAWRLLGLPKGVWRQISPYFQPIAKTLLREKCDLWVFPSIDAWSYQAPVPALVSIYDLMHRYERKFPEVSEKGEFRRREKHYKNICKWAKGVLVDSKVGKQQVMESYGLEESRIFLFFYIAPGHIYSHKVPNDFDLRYDLPKKFIFYPAQFWEHKNHKGLISAVGKSIPVIQDLKLVLAGSKKNGYDSAKKLVKELKIEDHVLFLGYVPDEDMPELYRRARALVMPTFFGPTNIPPLEAFVVGCQPWILLFDLKIKKYDLVKSLFYGSTGSPRTFCREIRYVEKEGKNTCRSIEIKTGEK
ncbi:MAG: glycosyltransferase family 4 protein [Nitrospirae bacterium]|nr:glycosyltransferase family 4 protein [Nitrospirota bacterium]